MTDTKEQVRLAGKLADADKPDEAMEIINKVLLDEPDNVGALYVAAVVMLHAARHVQAIQLAKRISDVAPKNCLGYGILALAYGEVHKYDESIRFAEKALSCRRDAKTLADMAYAYVNAGQWDLGEKYSLEALKQAKDSEGGEDLDKRRREAIRDAYIHLTYCKLAKKQWREGFEGYRRTLRTKWRKDRVYPGPDGKGTQEWMGEPDAVVVVTGEQGLGDEIMAASVVPDAAKACRKFVFDCDERLAPLFARSFPGVHVTPQRRSEQLVLPTSVGYPTHHKSLFGLSELLRRSDEDFPQTAYLVPDAEYVRMFRALLGEGVIGLAWSGGLLRTGIEPRTAGLSAFLPFLRRGGRYLSLQYKDDAEEVADIEKRYGVKVMRLPWVTQGKDVDLLAGLVAACSEVIGVHTSALHLSSALGVPTTILTHRGSGWRYGPDELLWYPPTTRMHKKRPGESWRDCVNRLVETRK